MVDVFSQRSSVRVCSEKLMMDRVRIATTAVIPIIPSATFFVVHDGRDHPQGNS